jgi:hypothetical protein
VSLAEDVHGLLARRAERGGFEPWLCGPVGADWRWWSWEAGRAGVERLCALLEPVGLAPGQPVGLPAPLTPPTVAGALAVALAGGSPVDVASAPAVRVAVDGWIDPATARYRLEIAAARPSPGDRSAVRQEADRGWPRVVRTARTGGDRPVMVWAGHPWSPHDLERVAWSVESEAALLLEPALPAFAASVLWARPTHLLERGSALSALALRLCELAGGRDPEGRLRRRLARLSAVWWVDMPPEPDAAGLFAKLGARVERWPFSSPGPMS